jgi:hypothetical protein
MPAAVTALRDAWVRALPVPPAGFVVHLGVAPDRPFVPRQVTVAAAWDADMEAVSVEQSESGAARRLTLTMDVACSVFVGGGGVPSMDVWRVEVGDALNLLDGAMRSDIELRKVVALARRGYTRWWDWWDTDGGPVGSVADFVVGLTVLP